MVFEITCCDFGTSCVTVGLNATKIAKLNLKEYVKPGLYIRNMYLVTEQLNEALGRPKFNNLVALMYTTLHVVFKEVLCDF